MILLLLKSGKRKMIIKLVPRSSIHKVACTIELSNNFNCELFNKSEHSNKHNIIAIEVLQE